jgi:hypothetical protein
VLASLRKPFHVNVYARHIYPRSQWFRHILLLKPHIQSMPPGRIRERHANANYWKWHIHINFHTQAPSTEVVLQDGAVVAVKVRDGGSGIFSGTYQMTFEAPPPNRPAAMPAEANNDVINATYSPTLSAATEGINTKNLLERETIRSSASSGTAASVRTGRTQTLSGVSPVGGEVREKEGGDTRVNTGTRGEVSVAKSNSVQGVTGTGALSDQVQRSSDATGQGMPIITSTYNGSSLADSKSWRATGTGTGTGESVQETLAAGSVYISNGNASSAATPLPEEPLRICRTAQGSFPCMSERDSRTQTYMYFAAYQQTTI